MVKYLGLKEHLFKETEAKRGSDDLPGNIDVKTRSKTAYDLIVQKGESPDKRFILVTIQDQKTLIWGWCWGKDAMQEQYWADPARGRPAYFFPKEALRSMNSLQYDLKNSSLHNVVHGKARHHKGWTGKIVQSLR
jgi:hypothetical protein